MMIVAVCAFVLQSCKSKPTDKDVQAVVENFVKAIANDNYDKAKELATDGTDAMLEVEKLQTGMIPDSLMTETNAAKEILKTATLSFGATTFNEDGTTAEVNFTSSAGNTEETMYLKKVDDKWLVDFEADMPPGE